MIQEVGCDLTAKCITWLKVRSDFEILLQLQGGLRPDKDRRFWIEKSEAIQTDFDAHGNK